jgi:hypothetical protein
LLAVRAVFVEAFTKLQNTTVSFIMSVRLYGITMLPLDGFLTKNFCEVL